MDNSILSVSALTDRLRRTLEGAFPYVWVKGEVTNLARPASGHIYFSLRDGRDLLNCVWFRHCRRTMETFDPLTGEVFSDGPKASAAEIMHDGDMAVCAGTISVYPDRGQYQLRVELVQCDGEGDLLRRLELLKKTLAAKGWFSQERKRPIPKNPSDVIVITAPGGAAVRDFVRIASRNATGTRIRIIPVPVQGSEAPPAIIRAIARANTDPRAQTVAIIRGGGSLEDLWAFNDENLAEAIVRSRLPVITGIGHEIDTSICDLAADVRAATPTHAAQILWPGKELDSQRVDALEAALANAFRRMIDRSDSRLSYLEQVLASRSPLHQMELASIRLDHLSQRLGRAGADLIERHAWKLETLRSRLESCSPDAPLKRGYAMILNGMGLPIVSARQALQGDALTLQLADGAIQAVVTGTTLPSRKY